MAAPAAWSLGAASGCTYLPRHAGRAGWPKMLAAATFAASLLLLPSAADAAQLLHALAAPASATTPLIMLTDPKAKCMDGSQSGIYVHLSPTGSSKWIFTLQGGGECVTERRCKPGRCFPLFPAIFNRKMQKLPSFRAF